MDEFEKQIIEDIACKYKEIKPLYKKLLKYMKKKYLRDIPTKLNIKLEEDSSVEAIIDDFRCVIDETDSEMDYLGPCLESYIKDIDNEYRDILKEREVINESPITK